MPEKDTSVYLNLNYSTGSEARVISCSRTNGDECSDTNNPINKTFMVPSGITFKMNESNIDLLSSDNAENMWNLNIVDDQNIKIDTGALFNLKSNNGIINIKSHEYKMNSPFEINFTGFDGYGANIRISGTIEVSGKNVAVKAEARLKLKSIDDAPKEIKITAKKWGKLALKLLGAALVVAAACVVAVALAPAAIIAAVGTAGVVAGVIGTCVVGGAVYAGVTVHDQKKKDKENGIERSFTDYLYMGLDKFSTGAIVTAPTAISPLSLPQKLLGVAGASVLYQGIDMGLDSMFGGDFYDSDSSFAGTILMDTLCTLFGEVLGSGLNQIFKGISNKIPYLDVVTRTQARQYIRETYDVALMKYWQAFLDQTALKRGIYQGSKKILLNDYIKSILTGTPANEIFNNLAIPFSSDDYKEMGKDTYFEFNDNGQLILTTGN